MTRWEVDLANDSGHERIDFDFVKLGILVRLSFWDDGQIWFRACEGGKHGWNFNYAFEARLNSCPASSIVKAFEDSLIYLKSQSEVMQIWSEFEPVEDKL